MPASWSSRTDGQLLRDASREPDAFGELYRRHETIVFSFLARRTREAELTADLAAETFAIALERADRFRDTGQPAIGWLLGIARHQLLDAQRSGRADDRARRRLGVHRPSLTDPSFERIEALIDAGATSPRLHRALAALPTPQRHAVEAFVLDERPYADLARDLGITEATMRQRVSRGLSRLRTTFESTR